MVRERTIVFLSSNTIPGYSINITGTYLTANTAISLLYDGGAIIFNASVHNYLRQPEMAALRNQQERHTCDGNLL